MSRTVDPRPVLNRSTRPRHEAVEAQREHSPQGQADNRRSGGTSDQHQEPTRRRDRTKIATSKHDKVYAKSVPAHRCAEASRVTRPETCTVTHGGERNKSDRV